jgi:hypothetical protein
MAKADMTDVLVIEKPVDCHYVHDRNWRFEPANAKARKALADLYRYMRRDEKAPLARALFKTEQNIVRSVRNAMTDAVLNGTSCGHVGGIGKLLS